MKKAELVFVPSPGAGHLVSIVEFAKLLVDRDDRLSIMVLIMKLPFDSKTVTFTESLAASNLSNRIRMINLPDCEYGANFDRKSFFTTFIEDQKPHVREAVNKQILSESGHDSPKLAGFVLDMFCTHIIDVANEFEVPSYIFFTSGAASLGMMLHVQALQDEQKMLAIDLKDSDAELEVSVFLNPVPLRLLPGRFVDADWDEIINGHARRYRRAKGIIVNTFLELESHAIGSLKDWKIPPVYPVGPILNLKGENYDLGPGGAEKKAEIMMWLDDQPPSSVVFLCFGSMGSFSEDQVKEIAYALEQSGHRFLWSLRRSPPKGNFEPPSEYTNLMDVLPEGFLDRTAHIGKIIGWAPQVAVLGHPSVGGFVSHCGWNSTLESLWFGVPIAAWPMYAEQQQNAFVLVKELGLAVEIKMDYCKNLHERNYRKDLPTDNLVSAEQIERGIRCVMQGDSDIRKRVKMMSEHSRKTLMDGGSSFTTVGRLIDNVLDNIQ